MPRVHFVKSARKKNPVADVGESYFWWKFRYGGKRYSLKRPRPSQLTQSPYFSGLRSCVEMVEDWEDVDDLESLREMVVSDLSDLMDQCQESLDNMPESLQESPTAELLNDRISELESAMNEIESMDTIFKTDAEDPEEADDFLSDWKAEVSDCVSNCEV